jgi:oligoribonuclease NrnB/cAMP/cGMP phosphodiesterase (DHH superfamily)
MKEIVVIYHKDCIDGTAAAAVMLHKFANAKLYPLAHSYTAGELEIILKATDPEADIYTVDCGLGVREFLKRGFKVTTLDHHISEKEFLEVLEKENQNFTYIFDNNKSGASLTWSFFFPDEDAPELIAYVEDIDLWKWKYGNDTKHISNYLSMFRNDPEQVLTFIKGDLDELKKKGEVISMYVDTEIERFVSRPYTNLKIGEHIVPAFNITTHESASGNILSEKLDKAVALFTIKGDVVSLGFRSKDHQVPSSVDLATSLGGGGHTCAAGASVSLTDFIDMLVT